MTEARTGPCTAWTTPDLVLAHPSICKLDPVPDANQVDRAIGFASWLLFERTGRQWPGLCESTVIARGRCRCGLRAQWQSAHECPSPTGPAIRLGYQPIVSIESVTVDGVVVDPSKYHIEDWRWLVRTAHDESWGLTVDVTFTHGINPPLAGTWAATVLAAELLLAIVPGAACRLPERVTAVQRQGITTTWVDPMDYLERGLTGITEVDLFLTSLPGLRRRAGRVLVPGTGSGSVRRHT